MKAKSTGGHNFGSSRTLRHRDSDVVALFVAGFLAACSLTARAEDYQGTVRLFEKLTAEHAQPNATPATGGDALRKEIDNYKKNAATTKGEEAAKQWLALCDKSQAQLKLRAWGSGEQQIRASEIFAALPPPAAWESLRGQISKRDAKKPAALLLKLFGDLLGNDEAAQWNDVRLLQSAFSSFDRRGEMLAPMVSALADQSADAGRIVEGVEQRVLELESGRGSGNLKIPDLVTLAGKERAKELLRRALLLPDLWQLDIAGDQTQRLARSLAIENVDQIRRPPWELVKTLDSIALYEALNKKFPPDANERESYSRREAGAYYLLGLVAVERFDDAVRLAVELNTAALKRNDSIYLPYEPLDALDRSGHTEAVYGFLSRLLAQHPEISFWDNYIALAAKLGKSDEALKLVQKCADTSTGLTTSAQADLQTQLAKALLAADHVDEGVSALQRAIRINGKDVDHLPPRVASADPKQTSAEDSGSERIVEHLGDRALMEAKIGRLLGRDDWLNEGVRTAVNAARKLCGPEFQNSYRRESLMAGVAGFLREINRGPDAESLLQDNVVAAARTSLASQHNRFEPTRDALVELLSLYSAAGRADDVLALLEKANGWGAADLSNILTSTPSLGEEHGVAVPLGCTVAQALAAKGQTNEARKILDATMDNNNSSDREYELLLKIGGENIIPRLDQLFQRDQFEERPLIWKAHLLRLSHKLDEAEKSARAAIAIDPSDGEQGPGDRMRVYAVLGDILDEKGDAKQANSLREAVKAIRISENADRYYDAGLLTRGINMYQEALNHFADAYCIQSRMALRLSELGRNDEAEEHYRRAYELMPESFGRMESHCFGCEGAFRGKRAQSAAEKVFARLVAQTPNKPQVHYLLGYLREQQERFGEALELYRKAVALDPDYLNAWKHIHGLAEHVAVPISDRDAASLKLLRLDPQSRHEKPELEEVRDLRGLWDGVAAAAGFLPAEAKNLYALPASKSAMDDARKHEAGQKTQAGDFEVTYHYLGDAAHSRRNPLAPGEALAKQRVVANVAALLDRTAYLAQ